MEGSRHAMAQPDRLEGAPDAAVGVDGLERQLQPAAVSQRVAASTAAAEKRTSKATWRFLRRQLERAMLKRPDEARVLAAVAADDLRGNATLLAATSRPCC